MKYCEYADQIPCQTNDYDKFDDICTHELGIQISASDIINESNFLISLELDLIEDHQGTFLSVNERLSALKNKTGLYHLWVDRGYCEDHKINSMICVYVGKGLAFDRVKTHIKEKWPHEETIHISFYECENRISKYLEQLFLDTYNYHLNKSENTGKGTLYARWNEDRYTFGTEIQNNANFYEQKYLLREE